ncbi:MAG: TetR/AcrR family transcriptional regulator [Sphingomonadaceae bacterium]
MGADSSRHSNESKATSGAVAKVKLESHGESSKGRAPEVRRAMLKVAAELFAERGFRGTNLRDIAEALDMSRPGLYYHFSSKEKLLEALIEEVTVSAEHKLEEIALEADRDPEMALRLVLQMSAQWVLDNNILFRVLDRSEVEMSEELKASHAKSKKAIHRHFIRIIERGVAIGKFRPVDPHIAALTIVGMRNWAAWWYQSEGRLPKHVIVETIAEMAVRSLLRPDAHRMRSDQMDDVLRILKEDIAHLDQLLND